MNDGDEDINVVQGVGSTIAKSASSGGGEVTLKGGTTTGAEVQRWAQESAL